MSIRHRALTALLCLLFAISHADAEDTWVVEHDDPRSRLLKVESLRNAKGKHFQIKPWPQSWTQLVHRVPPVAMALDEIPGVRVKASAAGVQFCARVVLPRSIDHATGVPHTVILDGETTQTPQEWASLRVPDANRKLTRQVRILRARQQEIDAREAYVDLLILKVLGDAAGRPLEIWVGEPDLAAFAPDGFGTAWSDPHLAKGRPQRASHESAHLLVNGRLFLPRVVRSNGETWEFLKGLGFNTVAINTPPTLAQHERARRLGLWLVSPPPPSDMRLDAIPFDRVIAWNISDVKTLPRRKYDRPTLTRAGIDPEAADILLHRRHPLGTRMELSSYGEWLESRCRNARGNWVAVQTELPDVLVRQAMALGADSDEIVPQPEQIEALVLAGVVAGARGFWFDSMHRLDATTQSARGRAAAITLANAMLTKAQPWIVAGDSPRLASCEAADYKAAVLRLPRATLVIVNSLPKGGQRGMPTTPASLELTIPGVATLSHAWRLEHDQLRRVALRRVPGGARLELQASGDHQLIALTRDPLVLESLNRTTQGLAGPSKQAGEVLSRVPRPQEALAEVDPLQSLPAQMHWTARATLVDYQQPLGREAMTVELLQHGDFERGSILRQLGWQMGCRSAGQGAVTISPEGARSGLCGLKLYCPDANTDGSNQPLVWVLTAPVHLAPNQPVRIEGYVRISEPLRGKLLISDSLGRAPLRMEVTQTDGWAKFTMLRAAMESESLQLSFALTGPGTVLLDDLKITPIAGPLPNRSTLSSAAVVK